jgi:hypothetical protein
VRILEPHLQFTAATEIGAAVDVRLPGAGRRRR